jgi:hypothetical protein
MVQTATATLHALCKQILLIHIHRHWDSSVSIATCHGLDGPGIESQWGGQIFYTHSHWPWGPYTLLYNGYWVLSSGTAARALHWPPTPSSAEVKGRVQLYVYFPSGPVLGWILLYLYTYTHMYTTFQHNHHLYWGIYPIGSLVYFTVKSVSTVKRMEPTD